MQSQPDEKDQIISSLQAQVAKYEKIRKSYEKQLVGLSDSLADRDVQIVERDVKIADLNKEINELRTSTSWKVTRPLRLFKDFIQNPKQVSYHLLKRGYTTLFSSQRPLQPSASLPAQEPKEAPLTNSLPGVIGMQEDLSWEEFERNVLSQRDQYKGIFIQEPNIDWNVTLYQRPQHLISALGRLDYLAIYRTKNLVKDNVNGFRQIDKNIWLTNDEHVDQIENAVHSFYSTSYSLDVSSLMNVGTKMRRVYEYVDQIDLKITGDEETVRQLLKAKEFAFNGGADFIIATSRKLEEEAIAAVGREKVVYVPNGADVNHYRNRMPQASPLPESLLSFRKRYSNIVGYFGAIAPWLWYPAVNLLIRMHPDIGFIFIGPDYLQGLSRLCQASNVFYAGMVDYNVLPEYARLFDVCFIPFEPGEIAHTTSPLKLFEYFSLEKPVVVTSFMDECVVFPEVFHGNSIPSLSDAIQKAIVAREDPAYKSRLARLADENSWDERARRLEPLFIKDQQ